MSVDQEAIQRNLTRINTCMNKRFNCNIVTPIRSEVDVEACMAIVASISSVVSVDYVAPLPTEARKLSIKYLKDGKEKTTVRVLDTNFKPNSSGRV
jgi:hypothetical protein